MFLPLETVVRIGFGVSTAGANDDESVVSFIRPIERPSRRAFGQGRPSSGKARARAVAEGVRLGVALVGDRVGVTVKGGRGV